MKNGKQEFQNAKKKLEEEVKKLSIQELGTALLQEEDETIQSLESHLFVEKLLKDEKIYDLDFLKVTLSCLSLEALYRLATQEEQAYLSYLASLELNEVFDKTFEKMDWKKEGEEEEEVVVRKPFVKKEIPIRTFITRYVTTKQEELNSLLTGKVTHTSLVGHAKHYHIPLEPVPFENQQFIEAYQEYLLFVKDDKRQKKCYFNLKDYFNEEQKEQEESLEKSHGDEMDSYFMEHPNRSSSKRMRKIYSQRGLYLKGEKRNG